MFEKSFIFSLVHWVLVYGKRDTRSKVNIRKKKVYNYEFLPYAHGGTREHYSFFLHYLQQPIDGIGDINLLPSPDRPNVFQGAVQTLYRKQKKCHERIVYDTFLKHII